MSSRARGFLVGIRSVRGSSLLLDEARVDEMPIVGCECSHILKKSFITAIIRRHMILSALQIF